MTESPEQIAQRFRAAIPWTDGTACPPADDFWAAAGGQLPFERVRALVDHGARCARCAEAWRILAEVRREAVAVEGVPLDSRVPTPSPGRVFRSRSLLPLALSAVAAGGLWIALRPTPPGPPVERGTSTPTVRAESPAEQPARDAVLRWSQVPGARSYNVTVLTSPDLVVVHQALGLSASELRLPKAVSERAAGGGLLWNVDAVLEDGRTIASPTFEVRLK
jgi:hypothetical protein